MLSQKLQFATLLDSKVALSSGPVVQSWKIKQFHNILKSRDKKVFQPGDYLSKKGLQRIRKPLRKWLRTDLSPMYRSIEPLFLNNKGEKTHTCPEKAKCIKNVSLQLKVLRGFLEKREVTCNESSRSSDCAGRNLWNRTSWKLSQSTINKGNSGIFQVQKLNKLR